MLPRAATAVIVVIAVVSAGCGGLDGCSSRGLNITVSVVDDPPSNATVTNSTQVRDVSVDGTTLGEVLTRAVEDGSYAGIQTDGRGPCRVRDAFANVQRHDGDQWGYYLRHHGTVVRVTLAYHT